MKKLRIPLALALAAAFFAGAWMLVRPPELPESAQSPAPADEAPAPRAKSAAVEARLGAASVLSIAPRAASPGKRAVPVPRATLFGEYLAARSYKALYERLKNSPEQTPESWYVMYEMLRRCATVTERTTRQERMSTPLHSSH